LLSGAIFRSCWARKARIVNKQRGVIPQGGVRLTCLERRMAGREARFRIRVRIRVATR
jgi:hypothetical protein